MTAPNGGPIDQRLVSLLRIEAGGAEELAAMHAELFDPPWNTAAMQSLLEHPGSTALICKVRSTIGADPRPAGFAMGQLAADEAEILSIGVLPSFQKCGLGRRLVQGLSIALANAGAQRLFLEVAADNAAGIALYDGEGFARVGSRPGYYQRAGASPVDALVLARDL